MSIIPKKQIVKRYKNNPVITNDMMPFSCRGVYNSSAVKYNGSYIMVLRAEGYNLKDSFWVAESNNGYDNWKIKEMIHLPETEEYKKYGANQYDPRITKIDDMYYITFCVHGLHDARMGLMSTKNFKEFKWENFLTGSGFRNTVLFPEKINGLYAALERPNSTGDIWFTQSPDLEFWGKHEHMLSSRFSVWSTGKIGPCGTPIKTKKGWLIIIHSVQIICDFEYIYHAGVMLTELNNPAKIIRVGEEPILTPEESYETTGHAPNVIFASSQIVEDDGNVKIYYGASDRCQCVADTTVDLLLEAALER
ncbi:MAG: glycoside hydrolase family 130 protein [Spirochaetales bacterium]|nr:glycoside hydrolase family 130 protein [Spirochaetales bacterium]